MVASGFFCNLQLSFSLATD